MALIVNLKCVENLHGKADRVAKVTFRGLCQQSPVVRNAKRVAYFGQSFDWPVARHCEEDEYIEIYICNYNKYLADKVVGTYTFSLQQLILDGEIKIYEPLVDTNHRLLDTTITFEVNYYSPDGKVGRWKEEEFDFPMADDTGLRVGDDATSIQSSRRDFDSAFGDKSPMRFASDARSDNVGRSKLGSMYEGLLPGEDTISQTAMVESFYAHKKRRPDLIEQELLKARDFQICVTIIEAQQLEGLDLDPVIRVEVGEEHKYTSIKQSTNCPYFGEYFVFDLKESPAMIFDKMITITAYHAYNLPGRQLLKATNTVAGKRIIGSFKCDVSTVFSAPGHMYYHKWAVLLDYKDIGNGPKGFVKCDISVMGRGDAVKIPKGIRDEETNNIEGNLLLPAGVPLQRQRAVYTLTIYRAEGLPRTDLGLMASVRKAMSMGKVAFVDAFIKVSFVGLVGNTTVRKSYDPEWKEVLQFQDMFPPLSNRIKIQLCDSDTMKDDVIATHFIKLSQIMDPGGDTEGILPTFGPSWINFYGSTRNYQFISETEELNDGLGEGSAYRGRLLMELSTSLVDDDVGGGSSVTREKLLRTGGAMDHKPRKQFMLYATIFDATMIHKELKDKHISFEISIGKYGNTLDAKAETTMLSDDDSSEDSEDDDKKPSSSLLKKRREEEQRLLSHSTTEPLIPATKDGTHYYMPYNDKKPCIYTCSLFEDLKKRHYHSNLMERAVETLEEGLDDVKQMIYSEHEFTHRRIRGVAGAFVNSCEKYISQCGSLGIGIGSGKTKLDKYRLRACRNHVDKSKTRANEIKKLVRPFNVREHYKELREIAKKLRHLVKEPQDNLPDVFIWMLNEKKRIAYYRMPAREVLFTTMKPYVGKNSGKRQTIFLKKPGKKSLGPSGWAMQAKVELVVWLGEMDAKKSVQPYMETLPRGFEPEFSLGPGTPATAISYPDKHTFQLRAYIFQARSLIGSDSTGLSDPFARVIISNQCTSTRIVDETLSPAWDETLVFEDIVISAPLEEIKKTPLVVTVEIYDHDTVGEPEFLGRVMVTPHVKLDDEPYTLPEWPPQLEWFDVYRGTKQAGQLLAAFELLHGTNETLPPLDVGKERRKNTMVVPIPKTIKPTLSKYRIEVMFWGMRDLKRIRLLSVNRPRMDLECGGHVLHSNRIENMEKNSNFDNSVLYFDVDLPENEMYWPPLNFRCVDVRSFGREILVGVTTIPQLPNYIYQSPEEKARKEAERRKKQLEHLNAMQPQSAPKSRSESSKRSTSRSRSRSSMAKVSEVAIDIRSVCSRSSKNVRDEGRQGTAMGFVSQERNIVSPHPDQVSINMSLAGHGAGTQPQHLTSPPTSLVPEVTVLMPGQEPAQTETLDTMNDKPNVPKEATALNQAAAKEANKEETAKKALRKKELIADLDWWSKYYVTNEDLEKIENRRLNGKGKEQNGVHSDGHESDLSSDGGLDMAINTLDYAAIDNSKLTKLKEEMIAKRKAMEEEQEQLSGKKRKKLKKKTMKNATKSMKKLTGIVNNAFSKSDEEDENEDPGDEMEEDKSHIARIKKYQCDLEKVAGYEGFETLFHTFCLFRGKRLDEDEDDQTRVSGKFKGNVCVYKLDETEENNNEGVNDFLLAVHKPFEETMKAIDNLLENVPKPFDKKEQNALKLQSGLPCHKPFELKVMVYVIKATDLHPVDFNGKADPYLVVRCGRHVVNDKENKICNQLNPVFGKLFEFDATFPMDSMLDIKVMDYDLMSADDVIGETTIDLENRFFSKHRPRCGLQQEYEMSGYNIWRDPMKPTAILARLCKEHKLDLPNYQPAYKPTRVYVGGQTFEASGLIEMEEGELPNTTEHLALEALKRWKEVAGFNLVPEHIECRALYNEEQTGVVQGGLEMWVDMFPKDMPTPSVTVDITPRQPKGYELRCIIWNTDEVVLEDTNMLTGEASSDIFVKGYLKGKGEDDQSTDVHYRSLTGEGNFNWRYVFPFEYLKAEEKIVYQKSEGGLNLTETEIKVPPKLTFQVWDADLVSADDFLGSCTLDLNRIPRPNKDAKQCKLRKPGYPTLNLFKNKRCRGWWPVTSVEEGEVKLVGKIEAELSLLLADEAERAPVGLGREDPEGLADPNRPDSSFLWFMNPCMTLKHIIWKNYKWLILKIFLILLLIMFTALILYTMPGEITRKLFGN